MTTPQTYTVRPGDNLSKIAKQHGIANWKVLYFAPVNAAFRKQFPNPDAVGVGAKISIPANAPALVAKLRSQLTELRKLRQDIVQFADHGKSQLGAATSAVKKVGSNVDTAATLATLFVGLGSLLKQGFAWNAASGAAQKKISDEIVKGTITGLAWKPVDAAALIISEGETTSSSATWLAVKAVAQAWGDIVAPSFWANTASQLDINPADPGTWSNILKVNWQSWSKAVSTRPEDVERQARERWEKFARASLQRIDEQIRDLEKALL